MHEKQCHDEAVFLTLTYAPEHLPRLGALRPEDHQHFLKRLRRRLVREWRDGGEKGPKPKVRFFHCGEYGETGLRPHFHTILFGYGYPDRVPCGTGSSGEPLYGSSLLDSDWSRDGKCLGRARIGEVTRESCQYVAKYVTKKLVVSKGSSREAYEAFQERYERVDPETGELVQVPPEYCTCSNRPGIGAEWFARFKGDAFPSDFLVMDGQKHPIPRYYEKLLEREDPELLLMVKRRRQLERDRENESPARLDAMEKCAMARVNLHGGRE